MGTVALTGNDPGGILNGSFAKGQPGYTGANGNFASFDTMQSGINAQYNLLLNSDTYLGGNPQGMTIAQLANAYEGGSAPSSYIQNIVNSYGYGATADTLITPNNLGQYIVAQDHAENSSFNPSSIIIPGTNTASSGSGSSGGSTSSGGLITDIENWFVRGGLILVGGIIVLIGLYALMEKQGIVPSPGSVIKSAAA